MSKQKRASEAQELSNWKKLIEECRQGQESIGGFCKRKNLTVRKFYYWQRKVRERYPSWSGFEREVGEGPASLKVAEPTPMFLPLSVQPKPVSEEQVSESYRVELKSGHKIFVPVSISREKLADLIAVLELI